MNRSLLILLGALALGTAVFAGSYFTSQRVCMSTMNHSVDGLSWLRDEFHLSDAEMTRIRRLHEGYQPECARMCALIVAKDAEVQAALGEGTNVTAEAQKKLIELGELRAQCQAKMLEHFIAVSRTMPPQEGQRYLAVMKQVTLGDHKQTGQTMPGDMSGDTGHDQH
jgi:hypothetical protein